MPYGEVQQKQDRIPHVRQAGWVEQGQISVCAHLGGAEMKTSQKRAIWYSYREKQKAEQEKKIKEAGLWDDFMNSKYTSMTNYINYVMKGKGNEQGRKLIIKIDKNGMMRTEFYHVKKEHLIPIIDSLLNKLTDTEFEIFLLCHNKMCKINDRNLFSKGTVDMIVKDAIEKLQGDKK